ncbi:PAS-domain containing protein, partial [Acinetobacter baumannii]
DAAHALVFANRAAAALIGGPERPAPLSASLREVVRSLAYRGELGPGDPEALAAQILALDHSRPLRHLLRRTGGGTAEYRSIPLPEGGGFCAV